MQLGLIVTGYYNFETGSMTSILEQLGWESLHKRHKGNKTHIAIPLSRNRHPMTFQVPYARTDIYKYSFFQDIVRDWNTLPASIISSAESSEDPVARFTSLVRSRD